MSKLITILIVHLSLLGLAGCHSSSNSSPLAQATNNSASPPGSDPATVSCTERLPAEIRDEVVTIDVPQDFDPSSNPGSSTTTPFSVYLPERCPGELLPLILYGHGFAENRTTQLDEQILQGNPDPLLVRGYIVIKFDQRGHGDNRPQSNGGFARLLDPRAETRDAIAILDWAFDNAAAIQLQTEPDSGVPRDIKVGTLGGSYGGAFQLLLAALDSRIDVIAPDRTFHSVYHSILGGDALKAWMRLLSLAVQLEEFAPGQGVTATPALRTAVNQVGPFAPAANRVRTRADLVAAMSNPTAYPRPATESEVIDLVTKNSMDYFESQQNKGDPWGFGEVEARLSPVPALFTQGQRDVLFNVTEAYWNAEYFGAAGADVRILTHEDGHMNPIAGQERNHFACGAIDAQSAILAWLDFHLQGIESPDYLTLPKVCISVTDSTNSAEPAGVNLPAVPIGSLSGPGAVPVRVPSVQASITPEVDANGVFMPLVTIQGNNRILAGIPTVDALTVTAGAGNVQTAIALLGVGIRRQGTTFLVDQQITGFVEGTHNNNRNVVHTQEVSLPGVGERLQNGDEVGLLFYQHHTQYAPIVSPQSAGGITSVSMLIPGFPAVPPVLSALDPVAGMIALPNTYEVTLRNVELPIFVAGEYQNSQLTHN